MLKTDGIPPRLEGQDLQELICQQYWYNDRLEQEADVIYLKVNGHWHQLYFENGVIFWRNMDESPTAFEQKAGDPFKYPFVDLAEKHDLKDHTIKEYLAEVIPDGARISLTFDRRGTLMFIDREDKTTLMFIPV